MFSPPALPVPLPAVLAEVRSWADDAAVARTPEERASWVAGLRELVDATEAVFAHALASFDAHGDGETLHAAASTVSWLRGALRLAPGDAGERVRIARGSRDLLAEPITLLGAGRLTYDQLRAIAQAVRPLPEPAQPEAVAVLTELAQQSDVTAVRIAGQRLRHVLDPDGALRTEEQNFQRRYLQLSPLLDGMTHLDGLLDPEATTLVTTALAPFLVPTGPDDQRSAAQRRADGLTELATVAMASDKLPQLGGQPTHLQVLVPHHTLIGTPGSSVDEAPNSAFDITDEASDSATVSSAHRAVIGPAWLPEHPSGAAWLTAPTLERLTCDTSVARVLLGSDNLPMELGRDQRLFTPHQRRALALRDGGCRFPGCNRPARYTDAHHIRPWQDGGPTDLENALLLCRHHHRHVHDGTWVITTPAGPNSTLYFSGPDNERHPSHPRGP